MPEYMREGIINYILHGLPPGGFLEAIICGDFFEAVRRADDNNIANLPAYATYFFNNAPMACFGSPMKMEAWIKRKQQEREQSTTH